MTLRHLTATVLLGPLLLIQGRRVRRRTPVLPEARGARFGVRGSGPELRLLFVGDSAAAGVGADSLQQALPGQTAACLADRYRVHWHLHATTGATTASILESLPGLDGTRFDVAVTSLGVNDVTARIAPSRWLSQQHQLRIALRERCQVRRLVISGLPPMRVFPALPQPLRWYLGRRAEDFNTLLARDLAVESDSHFLPLDFERRPVLMAEDGFHPGPAIYTEWGRRVAALVDSMSWG